MESGEVSVKDSPGLCRCCLSEGCYKDMGTEYNWMNETEVYAEMLLDCFDIGITQHTDGPNGPRRLICEVCITRLRDACNFKKQVLDSEWKFIDMLGRGEFASKVLISPHKMKAEAEEVSLDSMDGAEVEYLEDMDFHAEDNIPLTAIKAELPGPSTEPRKRGRPRKHAPTPLKKPRKDNNKSIAKGLHSAEDSSNEHRKKEDYITLIAAIIENSTIMPFKFYSGKYACFFCCCPFDESSKLKEHYKDEHADHKVRNVFRSVIKNCKIKLEISYMACKKCSTEFLTLDDLLKHFLEYHDMKINLDLKNQLFTYKISDEAMSCHHCGEEFRSFGTLLKHTHAKHNLTQAYVCEICGQAFIAKSNVKSHVRTVHGSNLNCEKCSLTFPTLYAFQNHNRAHHPGAALKCPHCPEVFNNFYRRNKHLATAHGIERHSYECNVCNRVFTIKSKMVTHKLRVHVKEKNYQCAFCPYKAFNKEGLTKHMVSHDDSRPFSCDFCKKSFQRKKTLELHRRIHTNDKRYACRECGKAFVQCTSLKLHYRVHHPKETPGWK